MPKLAVLALVFATGCATTGASSNARSSQLTPWGAVSNTISDCQTTPMLCRSVNGATTPYIKSGPFMPQ